MPRHSPYLIELSGEERAVLESMARSYTSPYWEVTRARMVLLAGEGLRNDEIAARLRVQGAPLLVAEIDAVRTASRHQNPHTSGTGCHRS